MLVASVLLFLAVQRATSQELGRVYNATVQQGVSATLKYIVDTNNHTVQTVRVMVSSPNVSVANPVFVSVTQLRGITSWQIPFLEEYASYYEVGHTVCPTLNNPLGEAAADMFNVTVVISTSSATPVVVFVEANAVENFILRLNKPITIDVTASSPAYYAFHFTSDLERVLVKVQSSVGTEEVCAVASLQIASCPSDGVNSELFNVDGAFQSMRSLAAITTDRPDTQNYFYLVVSVFEDSSDDCRVSDSRGGLRDSALSENNDFLSNRLNIPLRPHGPVKNVTVVIEEATTSYAAPIVVSIMVFVSFYLMAFGGILLFDYYLHYRHWIHDLINVKTSADDTDFGDLEKGNPQMPESTFERSQSFRRRPSLKKVIAGTYLNEILAKEGLSQTPTTPGYQRRTGSVRGARVMAATQIPRADMKQSRKLSDSDLTALQSSKRAYSPPNDLTQSLPPNYHYRRDQSTESMATSVIPASGGSLGLGTSPASVGSPVRFGTESSYSRGTTADDEQSSESEKYSRQSSTASGSVPLHKEAVKAFEPIPESSEISGEGSGTSVEMQPLVPAVATGVALGDNERSVSSIASFQVGSPVPRVSPAPPTGDEAVLQGVRANMRRSTVEEWMVRTLADLNIYDDEEEQIRYRRYCWHMFTIAVFYALPAFQLILTYQQLLNVTGNQDICYYNYLCSRKLGALSAFNNVWSNIGYVALGVLFILIAYRRRYKYKAIEELNFNQPDPAQKIGVPQRFGIYYTIGLALVAEGFMSAFYHVCPNDANFQFDTAFMFVIAGLGIYQIFQSRHLEFAASAHVLYLVFAGLIILAFCGTLYSSAGFWIATTIVYIAFVAFASVQFYYHAVIQIGNLGVARQLLIRTFHKIPSKPGNKFKFCYAVVCFVVNFAWAICGLALYFSTPLNFNSFILYAMIGNFVLYLGYYVMAKCIKKENSCHHQNAPVTLFVYLIIALLCWIPAIVFFTLLAESDTSESPARSRDYNQDCLLMDFFNAHDIWHFFSAFAIFFSYLMVMSLDDNREHVFRKDLRVF